jgi:hypothetical protein
VEPRKEEEEENRPPGLVVDIHVKEMQLLLPFLA